MKKLDIDNSYYIMYNKINNIMGGYAPSKGA